MYKVHANIFFLIKHQYFYNPDLNRLPYNNRGQFIKISVKTVIFRQLGKQKVK